MLDLSIAALWSFKFEGTSKMQRLHVMALARTYDPLTDRSAVRPDAPSDTAMARAWYEKAKDLGSTEAAQRLTQLPASVPVTRPSLK